MASPLLFIGAPGSAEWIIIIIALITILTPVILVAYLVRRYLKKRNEKQVIRKL